MTSVWSVIERECFLFSYFLKSRLGSFPFGILDIYYLRFRYDIADPCYFIYIFRNQEWNLRLFSKSI